MRKIYLVVAKSVTAMTVAASVLAVANPADAVSSKAEQVVIKAEKLGAALKKEISPEYRKVKYPKNVVGYPDMKLYNDTKQALAEAKKAVASLKGKEKDVLSARLDANVALHINRTAAYIDAVNSGVKIQKLSKQLNVPYAKGIINDQTVKLYEALNSEITKSSSVFDRVYDASSRAQFKSYYIQPVANQLNQLHFPVTIKKEIDKASAALKAGKIDEAAQFLGNVDYLLKEAAKKGQTQTNKLIKGSLAKQNAVQADFSKKAVLFTAKTSPVRGSQTINQNVYVYAGVNEQLSLVNLTINGNVIVLGSPAGAGSVSLENVKVMAGKITIENVADSGLHLKGVEAAQMTVNDADDFHVVAEKGTKITSLLVSDRAGVSGKNTLEIEERGAVSTITIASKPSAKSRGTELKGNLSQTNLEVTGPNVKLSLAKSTEVNRIEFKAPGQVNIPQGSKVKELLKEPSVKGEVKAYNMGTIEKAGWNVNVSGYSAGQVVQPEPVPVGEEDPGNNVPKLDSLEAKVKVGTYTAYYPAAYNATTSTYTVSLANLDTWDSLMGIEIKTTYASKFTVTSMKGEGSILPAYKKLPQEHAITGGKASIKAIQMFTSEELTMHQLRYIGHSFQMEVKLTSKNSVESGTIYIKFVF